MATTVRLAHGNSLSRRTAVARRIQTILAAMAEHVSAQAWQAPPDTELLLLPFPDGDLQRSVERVFSQLGSHRLLLPLQVSSGSICAHLPSPALTGSGLKGRRARPLQLPHKKPPDQKHDRHLAALKQALVKTSSVKNPFPKQAPWLKPPTDHCISSCFPWSLAIP